nr:immunoglobulin heavy chain junction region [Macaca mulatta]MOW99866.1 immunoglobulin heavy chain junction region [Macaca mulatta]MOX00113.1 immunoglobulin heavy chain junction region [Macaca mulatta]MOX01027.1 immunoglobulin heavy chain junction region [Macaca mulatta]MOX01251.1 immunoglobulin heavy chain junction region [Macaca mulatta]
CARDGSAYYGGRFDVW